MTTLEKIRAEIAENQKVISETLSFDKENEFYNGKWAGFELALAIIDRYASEECTNDCEHCVYLECPKEPCEDAVSRQAVLNEVRAIATWHSGDAFNEDRVIRHMKMLPSVNLTRAHGEWILINPLQENDGGAYVCSKCHHGDYGCETYNFCFNCGADMRGAEDAK